MHKWAHLLGGTAALALLCVPANAQFSGNLPPGSVLGNATASAVPARPVPADGTVFVSGGALGARAGSSSVSGIVPASGGGTTNFLRADFTWSPVGASCSALGAFGLLWENSTDTGCTADATHLYWTPTDSATVPYNLTIKTNDTTGINGALALNLYGGNDSDGGAARFSQTVGGGSIRVGYGNTHAYGYIDSRNAAEAVTQLVINGGGATAGAAVSIGGPSALFVGQTDFGMMPVSIAGASNWWIPLGQSGALAGGLYSNAGAEPSLRFGTTTRISDGAAEASFIKYRLGLGGLTAPTEALDATGNVNVSGAYKVGGAQINCGNLSGGCTGGGTPGASGSGLYSQVRSATPTASSTGLTTSVNLGTAAASDGTTGYNICGATNAGQLESKSKTAPATPYNIDAIIQNTPYGATAGFGMIFGWYDGTKLQVFLSGVGNPSNINVVDYATVASGAGASSVRATITGGSGTHALGYRLKNDGTNVYFQIAPGADFSNAQTVYTVAIATAQIANYNTLIYGINANNGATCATMLSYSES